MSKLRITTPNSISWNRHSSGYLILQYMSVWNSPKVTHIYTVSITYFVLKFYERFLRHTVLSMCQALIFTYILELVCTGLYRDAAELIHGFTGA